MDTAQQMIARLNEHGMTDQAIAEAVASTQPTIWRIRTGATQDCSSSLYMKLSKLSQQVGAGGTEDV